MCAHVVNYTRCNNLSFYLIAAVATDLGALSSRTRELHRLGTGDLQNREYLFAFRGHQCSEEHSLGIAEDYDCESHEFGTMHLVQLVGFIF
ncbi:hypothetical protein CDAR_455641 [Caerostris darwini]|uniref:Uncharacterized protein n=1 Tax=Caerostris darwini TaxID=1538125 RepID=A0AAV4PPM4_9ARAC|nr:hypothetical protein CDAR_455641 [Caerostris darwini]